MKQTNSTGAIPRRCEDCGQPMAADELPGSRWCRACGWPRPAPSNPAGTYLFGEPERRLLKWLRRVFGRK